jgi:acetyl esterase/lipase
MAPDDLRYWFEKRALPLVPKGISVEPVEDGVIAGEWQRPREPGPAVIFYIHGGGYVFGSPRVYRTLTFPLALAANASLFALRYPMAPESRCPAPIESAVAGYERLLAKGIEPGRIVFGGDSAGGGLALAALQAIAARGMARPAGAFLFSPWTDLTASGASVARNAASDCMFQEASIRAGGKRYAGTLDLKDPRASPLFGAFRGLPPLLVFASAAEMLYDDATRLVERARAEGVSATLESWEGLPHVWQLFAALMPEARQALALTAEFVKERTKSQLQRLAA